MCVFDDHIEECEFVLHKDGVCMCVCVCAEATVLKMITKDVGKELNTHHASRALFEHGIYKVLHILHGQSLSRHPNVMLTRECVCVCVSVCVCVCVIQEHKPDC